MARLRDYALVGGFAVALVGGLVLSIRPGAVEYGIVLLVPGLLLFLWGLLTTPDREE